MFSDSRKVHGHYAPDIHKTLYPVAPARGGASSGKPRGAHAAFRPRADDHPRAGDGSCLKTGQHSIFLIISNIKKNTRMLDTLLIDDFIDIMEQYVHY